MSAEIYDALSRTAQLLRMDVFHSDPEDDHKIIDGLRSTSARIVANGENLACPAAQTALVTLYAQLAMTGLQVELDLPAVNMLVRQPPLRDIGLEEALRDYSDDLLPGGSSTPTAEPHITFALGDSPYADAAIRVSGTDTRAVVGPDSSARALRWTGTAPFGGIAAAAAAATEAARAAVRVIADRLGVEPPAIPAWTSSAVRCVDIDLQEVATARKADNDQVDVVSGGAITNAMIFTLLRAEEAAGLTLRVVEPELLDLSNLNRYAMARRSLVNQPKTAALASYSGGPAIQGVPVRVDPDTALSLRPWANKVAIGVDDIPSRWLSQREAAASWVGVGATSHDYVLVSEHLPDHACAGCTHPRPDETEGPIPTIGFVSLWAGLIMALKLLAADGATASNGVHAWPLGLENARGIDRFVQSPVPNCPVACPASRRLSRSIM